MAEAVVRVKEVGQGLVRTCIVSIFLVESFDILRDVVSNIITRTPHVALNSVHGTGQFFLPSIINISGTTSSISTISRMTVFIAIICCLGLATFNCS